MYKLIKIRRETIDRENQIRRAIYRKTGDNAFRLNNQFDQPYRAGQIQDPPTGGIYGKNSDTGISVSGKFKIEYIG